MKWEDPDERQFTPQEADRARHNLRYLGIQLFTACVVLLVIGGGFLNIAPAVGVWAQFVGGIFLFVAGFSAGILALATYSMST